MRCFRNMNKAMKEQTEKVCFFIGISHKKHIFMLQSEQNKKTGVI